MTLDTEHIPPYVSYRTFNTFLESLILGIPDCIDRSVFDSRFSGSNTSQIMSTLRALSLIDAEGRPRNMLRRLVESQNEERRRLREEMLRGYYGPIFNHLDLSKATQRQLRQAFRDFGTTDSMIVKCESFFIHAALDAGIPLSRHILSHRKRVGRNSSSGGRAQTKSSNNNPDTKNTNGNGSTINTQTDAPLVLSTKPSDNGSATLLSLADKVLDKYPDFDPNWTAGAQESWMAGMERLANNVISKLGSASEDSEGTKN